ncbi:hypothetical protein Leryth_015641 [Lithospermum erythrorhizon]|nr:hypothetical protein Leryth_015641 [Lithospermum erythrorhizon]
MSRLITCVLSQILGISVGCRVGGWNCLKDVNVKLKKGTIESVYVGQIRLSLRQPLVKVEGGFMAKDPKLQILICDLEIVTRDSKKKRTQKKAKSGKTRSSGGDKWKKVTNVARFFSVCIADLVVKTPKASLEVKKFNFDMSKDGGSKPNLSVELNLISILVHLRKSRGNCGQEASLIDRSCSSQTFPVLEKMTAPFSCEEFSLLCECGQDRETGVVLRKVDITNGKISINVDDSLFPVKQNASDTIQRTDAPDKAGNESGTSKKTGKKDMLSTITKFESLIPEKFSFTLPNLDMKFVHREYGLVVDNSIMGIELKSSKSRLKDAEECTKLDLQLEFREIHLLREAGVSVVEIVRLAVISSAYIPLQLETPVRSDINITLGGTQCNLIVSRFIPLLKLQSLKKKKVPKPEGIIIEKSRSTEHKKLMWECTMAVPEVTLVLFDLSSSPVCHCCSQSFHVVANNISSAGSTARLELGECNLHMSDVYQECLKENPLGVETKNSPLVHIAKIGLDWGKKDMDSSDDNLRLKKALLVDVSGADISLTLKSLESLIATALSFESLLKQFSLAKKPSQHRRDESSRTPGKGLELIKFNLERCSLNFSGEVGLENVDVADPKRVNYGSQGGRVLIIVSADGTPRTANITSTLADETKSIKYSISLDIFQLSFCGNKEKKSKQMVLQRATCVYQELLQESNTGTKVTLIDMQNTKFVTRSGSVKESTVCSLFSSTDISARWEPDVHITVVELGLHLKSLVHRHKLQAANNKEGLSTFRDDEQKKEISPESRPVEKQKKKESVIAVDVEMLRISAEVGDGVETTVQIQSIFSENARIGVLLEGILLDLNGARIFKSSRMQISRVPNAVNSSAPSKSEKAAVWDFVIRALDINICIPYRWQLRAIDDSIEEMLRALKLIAAAKAQIICPIKKESAKPKKPSSSRMGCFRFCVRKLAIEIEEEPLQGWLDEHYHLMKNEASELAVRLNFLDELILKGTESSLVTGENDSIPETKISCNGEEVDLRDSLAIKNLRDDIHKQHFRSYYKACQALLPSRGSGACKEGFQSGFNPSTNRTSIMSLSATELDVTLTRIEGGDAGKIEVVQKLDPVSRAHSIPFARLYGGKLKLSTGSLVLQLRNYTYPLLAGTSGRCEGRLVLAQQATCFQAQIYQNVYVGKWRKVQLLRSASGTTPPMKTYLDLPFKFEKGEIAYGVGFEPLFTDISYAFSVALRRANISIRNPNPDPPPQKKEKSLPWWDEMRNYIHGSTTLYFSETRWNILSTTDPYEKLDKLQILSGPLEIRQSDGRIYSVAQDFKIFLSSLENLLKHSDFNPVSGLSVPFLETPQFTLEVTMDWECASGSPMNHYLFALPNEGKARAKVFDPFRSTSLSLRFNLSMRSSLPFSDDPSLTFSLSDQASDSIYKSKNPLVSSLMFYVGPHDLAWIKRFWDILYLPPHKIRTFSRWPRYGVPRIPRSGNLSLDKVMTEFMLRFDSTPACIRNMPLDDGDPAKGLTSTMNKLRFEMYLSRGKQKYTFECKRDLLEFVYLGLDLHMLKAFLDRDNCDSIEKLLQRDRKTPQSTPADGQRSTSVASSERHRDDGFLLSSELFTVKRQAPKADPESLLAWQEAAKGNSELTSPRPVFENGRETDELASDNDDGCNDAVADNCLRISVYGLKILWTIENRDVVCSWVGGLSKAFQSPKPSPSRQFAQRKLLEENKKVDIPETPKDDDKKDLGVNNNVEPMSSHFVDSSTSDVSPPNSARAKASPPAPIDSYDKIDDNEEDGTRHFMVNVIEPQFNLHSEEAKGRFLLAAVSGRVLARSFHSVLQVGNDMIEQTLGKTDVQNPEGHPEMAWSRRELSVMLEHVQAHVAPTDVDPGAGIQWLPKINRRSPKAKRTGALLEQVFMPCDMYFRYTRHKGGTSDLKVKPLKELTFNSQNITARMTSRQFQVMLDVLTNLLFARLPKNRKSGLALSTEDDDDEEEADEVVPDGVEEVELARIDLEHREREKKLILADMRKLSLTSDASEDKNLDKDGDLWMITGGRSLLLNKLKKELANAKVSRKNASSCLRVALQNAAQLRLSEKEKNKGPSFAMRISLQIDKVAWAMLLDGKSFAEAEISDMTYDFDRDYKDIGVARLTTKYFVLRNCLPNAKSDMLLSAWNPPSEWGKKVMLRVDSRQGAPKDGNSPFELLEVEIYPLKIHLTETMYQMIWGYLFPGEEQDSQRRQEAWKVSTIAVSKRLKKGSTTKEPSALRVQSTKENNLLNIPSASTSNDVSQASKLSKHKASVATGSKGELRRTSSFDRSWEESVAESVANELVMQLHSSSISSSQSKSLTLDPKESKLNKPPHTSNDEKKLPKAPEDKKAAPKRLREFHNIKISQVELSITYEGLPISFTDLRLLMDTFQRVEYIGTWGRLFARVKKHIIWSVLKSVTGMQGKKFKVKAPSRSVIPDADLTLSDNEEGPAGNPDQHPPSWPKRPAHGAGDGFVTSVKGLFSSHRRKAKAFVLRTMRGEAENDMHHGDWSESEAELSPFARQLSTKKAKRLIRRHTKKFRSKGKKGSSSQDLDVLPSSPIEMFDDSDSSSDSSSYEDFIAAHQRSMQDQDQDQDLS